MDLGIAGRKALLFGASRGMGRACAMQLAREGVDVTLVARTEGPLTEAAAAIRTACPAARVTAVVHCPATSGTGAATTGWRRSTR